MATRSPRSRGMVCCTALLRATVDRHHTMFPTLPAEFGYNPGGLSSCPFDPQQSTHQLPAMPFALTDKFRHLASFEPFHIPTERSPTPKTTLPHALRYTGTPSLEAAVAALKTLPVTDLLAQGGGALFVRGLPVLTPEEIATAVLAFGGGVGSEYKQVRPIKFSGVNRSQVLTSELPLRAHSLRLGWPASDVM